VSAPALGSDRYLDLMSFDKKAQGGRVRFILLKRLGNAYIHADAPADRLAETLASCAEPA
jgi:3-dehydroquinate synthase